MPENRRVAPNQLRPRLKPRGKSGWSTTAEETSRRNAGSTIGIGPKNRGRKPKNSASAGTAASPRSSAKRAAPRALSTTGSPAGSAMPGEELWTEEWIQRKNGPRRHRCDSAQNQRSGIHSQSLRSIICVGRVKEIPVKIANSPSTTNTDAFMSSEPDSDVSSKGQRVSRGDGAFRGSSPPRWAYTYRIANFSLGSPYMRSRSETPA